MKRSINLLGEERRTGEDVWKMEDQFAAFEAALRRHPVLALQPPIRPIYVARPLHVGMIAAAMLALGPVPYAGALVSAILGTLTIPLVFAIGRRFYGPLAGLAAAAALAFSGYHLLYARKGFAEAGSLFFLTAAFGFYMLSRERCPRNPESRRYGAFFAAGLCWGLAVAIHDRWLLMLAIPLALELHALATRRDWGLGGVFVRGLVFSGGVLLPPAAIEFVHYAGLILCNLMGFVYPVPTYFEQLAMHIPLAISGQELGQIEGGGSLTALTYPYLYARLEGPVFVALLLAGLWTAWRRREAKDVTLVAWFLLPCVYYGLTRAAARYGSITISAGALLVGVAF
ncbi:MAG: glycosyltransferase family 39 protein, partial [Candidatus Methylomirabilis sp.]|nr:glycosyltransferase family 39 protein [Deltaproteobacteria bacterium]